MGVGPLAFIIENDSESDKKHGADNLRQGRKELRQAFKKAEALDYRLELDGKAMAGRFVAIEVANIPYTGPGLELVPKSDPGDGVLNVVCVRAAERDKVVAWLEAPHEKRSPLRAKRGRKLSFRWQSGPLRIDDGVIPAPKDPELVDRRAGRNDQRDRAGQGQRRRQEWQRRPHSKNGTNGKSSRKTHG